MIISPWKKTALFVIKRIRSLFFVRERMHLYIHSRAVCALCVGMCVHASGAFFYFIRRQRAIDLTGAAGWCSLGARRPFFARCHSPEFWMERQKTPWICKVPLGLIFMRVHLFPAVMYGHYNFGTFTACARCNLWDTVAAASLTKSSTVLSKRSGVLEIKWRMTQGTLKAAGWNSAWKFSPLTGRTKISILDY